LPRLLAECDGVLATGGGVVLKSQNRACFVPQGGLSSGSPRRPT
jgi:shikimate kinase